MVICDKYNPEELVEAAKSGKYFAEAVVRTLFNRVREIFINEPNVLRYRQIDTCSLVITSIGEGITYGFYDECLSKYGHSGIWNFCCEVFDSIPLAAVIDDRVLCVHGGLSPKIHTISEIHSINRLNSSRGAGVLFGRTAVETFLEENQLQLICRSHQLCLEGYKYLWDQKLLTIWSAPNYTYSCKNKAAVVRFIPDGTCAFSVFEAADNPHVQAEALYTV
ncbi:Serine/threonine-protein phosphatase 4 catalytic subunit [Trichinella spiralis]|uniref:protein-serine/threonine phosphatase n=1 Tax=Trichinella spiralis TaxID=6334 RepID=A0ABR3KR72_TRISP